MTTAGYSPDTYRVLIKVLKAEGYAFHPFSGDDPAGRSVHLRHDIDYSPRLAADLARLNADLGISALFCIQVRSPLYNLAAPEVNRAVQVILDSGQRVGLHVALADDDVLGTDTVAAAVRRDFDLGSKMVPDMEPLFSLHNPSLYDSPEKVLADLTVPGFVNLYSRQFTKDMLYMSDSNMRRSINDWLDIARNGSQRMQILLHPFVWMLAASDMPVALGRLMAQVILDKENEFATNHVFRLRYPNGLGADVYRAIANLVGNSDGPKLHPESNGAS